MGIFGPPDVEKMEVKRNVGGLIKALRYKKNDVRKAAAAALGKIGDARAVEPLIATLKDKYFKLRQTAAWALGYIGDARAVEPLIAVLKDEEKDLDLQWAAAWALERLGWKPDQGENGAWYWIAKRDWEKTVALGFSAVEPLISVLKGADVDGDARQAAASALGKIGDTRALEPLIAALKNVINGVRQAAAEALGNIGDARALEPLIAVLKKKEADWEEKYSYVRPAAARALGNIRDSRALGSLITALKDGNKSVRQAAVGALEQLGWKPDQGEDGAWYWIAKRDWRNAVALGPPAVEPFITVLKDEDLNICQAAAVALGKIGNGWALEPLIAALKDGRDDMRLAAADAIVKFGAYAVEPLIAVLKNKGEEWDMRLAAADAMVKIDDTRAQEPLIAILIDKTLYTSHDAARALGQLGWKPDQGEAGARYWTFMGDYEKAAALGALAVEPLIAVLKDEDWHTRQAAAVALVGIYRAGTLDEPSKKRILAVRHEIVQPHHDLIPVCLPHEDSGIGLDFPL
jgi:HEAT repeat protein